jgi:hypothetical protein
MKFLLFLTSILLISNSKAQSTTGYIAFNFVDTLNQSVNPNDFEFILNTSNTLNGDKKILTTKIQFDAENQFYLLPVDESDRTSVLYIIVKNKRQPAKQSEILINLNAKFKSPTDFQNLLVLNIPVDHPKLIIDMPTEKISWQYVPKSVKKLNGNEINFMDITFMQNWWNQ